MAVATLEMAQEWFEQRFCEVHVWSRATHPPTLSAARCPNGTPYVTFVNGLLKHEGEPAGRRLCYSDAVNAWYAAVTTYADLLGGPKGHFLWWRELPTFETEKDTDEKGYIVCRLAITPRGPFSSYTGTPRRIQQAAAA